MASHGKSPQAAEPSWGERSKMRLLDHDVIRVDGREKLTGEARYSHDMRLPDMVWARLVTCPVPHAHVTVDLEPALEMPGVAAALLVREGETSYVGQALAVVAAETPEQAMDAARAVYLEIEELPWAVTPEQAAADDAPQVSQRGNQRSMGEEGDRAAAEEALANAEVVVDETYTCPVQHHVCLETHGVAVDFRGGDEATIYASTQFTHGPPGEAARILELDASKVHCIVEYMGGGFGSKFSLDIPGQHACRVAKEIGRPVHLMLDRPQEFAIGGNRSGSIQHLVGGISADGEFTGLVSEMTKLGGVGRGPGTKQPYIYAPAAHWTSHGSLHTNTDSSRAMRAPGHPQASFAMESLIDELCYSVETDPLEFRIKNLDNESYTRQLRRVAKEIGWADHPHKTSPGTGDGWTAEGIGFGVSQWGGGGGRSCQVDVRIERDGGVAAMVGSQDLGTGTKTYVAAIVAEELGLPLAAVEARIGDSRYGSANPSGGSSTAPSLAPAVKNAAFLTRNAFAEHLADVLGIEADQVGFEDGMVVDRSDPQRKMAWKAACASLPADGLQQRGGFVSSLTGEGVHGAQAARVRVDLMTGEVKVLKMVCIQDVGLPLNTLLLRSQINGAMIGALSYALLEERVIDPDLGLMMNANLEDYRIAGCLEMPELVAIVDEDDTRQQVIGMGEPPAIPGPGAIANAIHNACGARVRDMPFTPDRVLAALGRLS